MPDVSDELVGEVVSQLASEVPFAQAVLERGVGEHALDRQCHGVALAVTITLGAPDSAPRNASQAA
jgi:hypothetical protein